MTWLTAPNLNFTRPGKHTKKTIETMAIEIVDLPINSMVIFHSYVNVYQRVSMKYIEISL